MLLLTRPLKDSMLLAEMFGTQNCVVEPMIIIEPIKINFDKLLRDNIQVIISTSKNAGLPDTKIPIVKIPEYGIDAEEIYQHCLTHLSKDGGKILYLSGSFTTMDIAAKLRNQGFDAKRVLSYKQVPATKLSANFFNNFSQIRVAAFYSEMTLVVFKSLCENMDLSKINCVCISEKVAKKAQKMGWKDIKVAKEPNSAAMINLIRQALLDS